MLQLHIYKEHLESLKMIIKGLLLLWMPEHLILQIARSKSSREIVASAAVIREDYLQCSLQVLVLQVRAALKLPHGSRMLLGEAAEHDASCC